MLELDLTRFDSASERDAPGALPALLAQDTLFFQQLLFTLHAAADDAAIAGVVVRLSNDLALGLARTEELLGALQRLRAAGKRTVAFASSMARTDIYLLASGFEHIYVPAMALLNVSSPLLQVYFFFFFFFFFF